MATEKINFTKKIIAEIPPAEKGKRKQYQDIRTPALKLEVTSAGKKTYKVYRKLSGRPVRYTIGNIEDWSIENARAKAEEISALIASGVNPNIEKTKIKQEITFLELFQDYMNRYSKVYKRSWEYDEREVNKYLSHWFNRRISDIHKEEIQKLHEKIGNDNGIYQANRILERTRAIFNKAIEWGWSGANPTQGIKKFKEKSRDRFIKPAEFPFFFKALEEEHNRIAADYILMSLYTGARKSNVLSMQWDEIDFEQQSWRIPETKNGEPLVIALPTKAMEILKKRKAITNSSWVFPSERTNGHLSDPKKAWKRILVSATLKIWESYPVIKIIIEESQKETLNKTYDKALYDEVLKKSAEKGIEPPVGLMDVRIHDLRRTLGSYQAASGANQYIIGKSLGHKDQQSTAIYARLDLDPVRASIETAINAMNGAKND